MTVSLFVSGSGLALVGLVVRCFTVWWRARVHRQNVDRVFTSAERLAEAGHLVWEVPEALHELQPAPRIRLSVHRDQPWTLDAEKDPHG